MLINQEAANEIMLKQYNSIYSFCRSKLINQTDAEDVTQEVFLFFQVKLSELESSNIRAWLYSVADKKIKEEYREKTLRSKLISYEDISSAENDRLIYDLDEYCRVEYNEIESAKAKILKCLTPDEQELFTKIYENHMKYSEISKELNISEKAVNMRSLRMRVKIKKMAEIAFMMIIMILVKIKR